MSAVLLRNARGEVLRQVSMSPLWDEVAPAFDDESFPMLRCVDPWGDTFFSRLQAPAVRLELQRLMETASSAEHLAYLREVDELAAACASGVHLFLVFLGD